MNKNKNDQESPCHSRGVEVQKVVFITSEGDKSLPPSQFLLPMRSLYHVWGMDICLGCSNSLCSCSESGCLLVALAGFQFLVLLVPDIHISFFLQLHLALAPEPPIPILASLWCFVFIVSYFLSGFTPPTRHGQALTLWACCHCLQSSCWRTTQLRERERKNNSNNKP